MRKLLVLVAAVSLLVTACGGSGDGDGSGGGGGAEEAAPNYDGSWSGQTSQGKAIEFTVSGNTIDSFKVTWKYGGSRCTIVENSIEHPDNADIPITDGTFTFNKRTVEGTFDSESTASGTGMFRASEADRPYCKDARFTWDATKS